MEKITDDLLGEVLGEENIDKELSGKSLEDTRIDQILNIAEVDSGYQISEEYLNKYKGIPERIIKDLEIFTDFRDSMIGTKRSIDDSKELEKYRRFPENTLVQRGLVYSEGIDTISLYDDLKYSSFIETINDVYEGRYLLPICLPNGDVFTFMGYDPQDKYNKYQIAKVSTDPKDNWIKQGRMLGNLDSLERYGNFNNILVVEGFFDAVHAEAIFNMPVIATLGANVRGGKLSLLYQIKKEYSSTLTLVPDFDFTGMKDSYLQMDVWDYIYNFNLGRTSDNMYKDIDDFLTQVTKEEIPKLPSKLEW